jgi:hypothetical protein
LKLEFLNVTESVITNCTINISAREREKKS